MIMTTTQTQLFSTISNNTMSSLCSTPSPTMSSSRSFTPPPSGSLTGRHIIYRGLTRSSMEYMSLTHTRHPEAAHMLKGEILISGQQSGYIQYTIVLDQEWRTRKVKLSAMYGCQEKRLNLEVDKDQRWYRVTEQRLARTRSFYRSGLASSDSTATVSSAARSPSASHSSSSSASPQSNCSMQDAEANYSDSSASCYSSSSDSECSIPFEKINLTWTPPPKGSKRASKRFSTSLSLSTLNLSSLSNISSPAETPRPLSFTTFSPEDSQSTTVSNLPPPCSAPAAAPVSPSSTSSSTTTSSSTSSSSSSSTTSSSIYSSVSNPSVSFASKPLARTASTTSLVGPKKYEHLPHLDGCIHLDLGHEISPSTFLLPIRRAALGIEPENMRDHLANLPSDATRTDKSALVSFPDLELTPSQVQIAFVGPGRRPQYSLVECWLTDDEDSTLVEVDGDGLVVRYGRHWASIPSS